ncbi:hypothetical protein [Ramlibacter humi]|uniref:Uncharacterized protein n=1 Tax=Ramlibacter humi TaxID=2530451 RepID=A0A4Z0BNV2_9BURK|nr:hypothetical protein [Ramlibacter humi]TFZ00100.1 hypothetical protein EZ216_13405 [Ramlibacter humi]
MALSHQQRLILIIINGKRTVGDILAMTEDSEAGTRDFDHLAYFGLIAVCGDTEAREPVQEAADDPVELQRRFRAAYPVAVSLTGSLGLAGFKLNLAVERATTFHDLVEVSKRLRKVVGPQRFQPLKDALSGQQGARSAHAGAERPASRRQNVNP